LHLAARDFTTFSTWRSMGLSLRPKHLARYRDLARLFFKYGRSDLVKRAGLEDALLAEDVHAAGGRVPAAEELAADLEKLGPTYIKLGQLLSTRADILPPAYMDALSRLQDEVDPFPFAEVETILHEELGVRVSKAFEFLEEKPLAAASLGQVHRAMLRSGIIAAVKVQRPGIRERIAEDLDALAELAEFVDEHMDIGRRMGFADMLAQFRHSLFRELDYLQEAGNLRTIAANLREFDRILVPEPIMDYTTSRVLTMELVSGTKITALSPLRLLEIDGEGLGETLFEAYLKMILVDGIFHADPHPGNVFLTEDNRIALLDLGMIGRVAPEMQEKLLRLLLAIADGQGEKTADIAASIGVVLDDFDPESYRRDVGQLVAEHHNATLQQIDVGRVVMEITRVAAQNGVRQPPELTLLGKALLNLDLVARTLAPSFNPTEAVRRHATDVMRRRMLHALSPSNVLTALLDSREFVQHLPDRMNAVFERLATGKLELKVNAIDEEALVDGIQKIANRITMGLVLAAMIVGAALLMRVETDVTILGYPALAIFFFLLAAAGGAVLVIDIWIHDRRVRRRMKQRRY
jgi:ubiquinone biosynthesis protein